jgi:hypothetical protein
MRLANRIRLPVKVGIGQLPNPMTKAQALRWAQANMPADLRRVGFVASVFTSDPQIHGADYFRVNYSMSHGRTSS